MKNYFEYKNYIGKIGLRMQCGKELESILNE